MFSPPPLVSDPDMHHGTCVTHVPWCMSGLLTIGFLWSRWRGKRSRHSRRMRNPQFYVSGKRPMKAQMSAIRLGYVEGHPSWWRHQMETFSALLALCSGNSPVNYSLFFAVNLYSIGLDQWIWFPLEIILCFMLNCDILLIIMQWFSFGAG